MFETDIDRLMKLGYDTAQISQLIKLSDDGIDIRDVFKDDCVLLQRDVSKIRDFRNIVKSFDLSSFDNQLLFDYLLSGVDYNIAISANLKKSQTLFILDCLYEMKKDGEEYNIDPLLEKDYPPALLQHIWDDIKYGIDVNIYLKSGLPQRKMLMLREGLYEHIDLTDDLKSFSFLDDSDLPYLKALHRFKLDYKSILKKYKNAEKTICICDALKDGYNLLDCINPKMTISVIKEIYARMKNGEDMSMCKTLPLTSVESIPMVVDLYKRKYPIKKIKKDYVSLIPIIIYGLDLGLDIKKIDETLKLSVYEDILTTVMDCYKYQQEQYIDFVKLYEGYFLCGEYCECVKKMLRYNFEHQDKQYNIIDLMINKESVVEVKLFKFIVANIIEDVIDKNTAEILIKNGFSVKQSEIIVSSIRCGYDISCFMDNRLTTKQMRSIKTCLDLGLSVNKTKEYDFSKFTEDTDDGEAYFRNTDIRYVLYESKKR